MQCIKDCPARVISLKDDKAILELLGIGYNPL